MELHTALTKRLGLTRPIFQAPMAGGPTTPDLVVAVCEAGGLGFVAAAYLTPAQIRAVAQEVRTRTKRPFGINLFAPTPAPAPTDPAAALAALAPFHRDLGLPPPSLEGGEGDDFDACLAEALASGAAVLSFTFGLLPEDAVLAAKERGILLIGTATTVSEARQLEAAGVDAVVAQGSEAGAHRGSFAVPFEDALIGTIALVPQVADALSVPVVASGGVMDGRGLAAALALGAAAVQMGTAFLTCFEAGTPEAYKAALLAAREDETRLTRAFSGRPARGVVNRTMTALEDAPEAVLPYPLQNALTRPMRKEAATQGRSEFLSLWAGQGLRLARRQGAAQLMESVTLEAREVLRRLSPAG